jgi:hypothetical protein
MRAGIALQLTLKVDFQLTQSEQMQVHQSHDSGLSIEIPDVRVHTMLPGFRQRG